ncbi:TPA: glutamyl-tRNA reductase, partial [Staphylococcus aureus]
IKQAKELSSDKKSNEKLELFQNIFDIEAECPHEQAKQQKESKVKEISARRIFSFE